MAPAGSIAQSFAAASNSGDGQPPASICCREDRTPGSRKYSLSVIPGLVEYDRPSILASLSSTVGVCLNGGLDRRWTCAHVRREREIERAGRTHVRRGHVGPGHRGRAAPLPCREDAHAGGPDVNAVAEIAPRSFIVAAVGRGGRHDAIVCACPCSGGRVVAGGGPA